MLYIHIRFYPTYVLIFFCWLDGFFLLFILFFSSNQTYFYTHIEWTNAFIVLSCNEDCAFLSVTERFVRNCSSCCAFVFLCEHKIYSDFMLGSFLLHIHCSWITNNITYRTKPGFEINAISRDSKFLELDAELAILAQIHALFVQLIQCSLVCAHFLPNLSFVVFYKLANFC